MNKDILNTIQGITDKSASGGYYLYRGEPAGFDTISSRLYRAYQNHPDFNPDLIETSIWTIATQYTDVNNQEEVLSLIQHYGGDTNYIDFTMDYLIALFFACDGHVEEDGRVILLRRQKFRTLTPKVPSNRVTAQKSVFVRPPTGKIDIDNEKVSIINVPRDLKKNILEYLRKHHGIYSETVYNDLHGFIKVQALHNTALKEFYRGLSCFHNQKYQASIGHYNESIKHDPVHAGSWNNRGLAYIRTGEINIAISDLHKAIELESTHVGAFTNLGFCYLKNGNLDKAIAYMEKALELDPTHGESLFYRALYWLHKGIWKQAKSDLDEAKKLGADVGKLFKDNYNDFVDIEQEAKIMLPEDIKEMIQHSSIQ